MRWEHFGNILIFPHLLESFMPQTDILPVAAVLGPFSKGVPSFLRSPWQRVVRTCAESECERHLLRLLAIGADDDCGHGPGNFFLRRAKSRAR